MTQIKRQEQIQERAAARVIARTKASDLNDTAVVKHIIAAFARELDGGYYDLARLRDLFDMRKATGDDLVRRSAEIAPHTLRPFGSRRAVGFLVFSRRTNTGSTTVIPAGTLVLTSSGVTVRTTLQVQIDSASPEQISGHGIGRDSGAAAAVAVSPGAANNVAIGQLIRFGSRVAGVDEVTNTTAFTQGRDKELDDQFRDRAQRYIESLSTGTAGAYEFLSVGVLDEVSGQEVVFAHVFEDPFTPGLVLLYIDDGTGTAQATLSITGELVIVTALGGETFLELDEGPIRMESPFAVRRNGATLTFGTDYSLNPITRLLAFATPLTAGDQITADYIYFTGLIAAVQQVIEGVATDRLNFPGSRAAGTIVRVLSPDVVTLNVEATLTLLEGFDTTSVRAEATNAVATYINTLGISGDVVRTELIARIKGVRGVYDVDITDPTGNLVVLDDQIARIDPSAIDFT